MKKLLFTFLIIAGACSISLIYSCKKKDDTTTTNPGTVTATPLTAQNSPTVSDDANYYKSENDQSTSDVNNDLATYPSMQGARTMGGEQIQAHNFPCGVVSVDTSNLTSLKKITYNFGGDCFGRHRSGSITVQLTAQAHWSDVNAVLTFTYNNYTVTRLYGDKKSITFNGTKTVKNINGSDSTKFVHFLTGDGTFIFQERTNNMKVSFDGGTTATWNTAYTTQWSYNPLKLIITLTASGDTLGSAVGGYSNVYIWGTTRFGQQFYSEAPVSVVWDSHCDSWQPLSGQVIHHIGASSLTITLGLDANGNPFSYTQGDNCPTDFKVEWVLPNTTGSAVIAYY